MNFLDPLCGADETCSTPAFVNFKNGAIEALTVNLPFVNTVSNCEYLIERAF